MTSPQEALDRVRAHIAKHQGKVQAPFSIAGMQALVDEIDRLRSTAAPQAVKVKGLEWKKYRNGDADAISPFDEIYTAYSGGHWRVTRSGKAGKFVHAGSTIEAAKAAAQADYERRILSALQLPKLEPAEIARSEDDMPERIWAGDFDGQGFGHCVAGMQGGLYTEYVRADLAVSANAPTPVAGEDSEVLRSLSLAILQSRTLADFMTVQKTVMAIEATPPAPATHVAAVGDAPLIAALQALLDCPDIADNDHKDEETHAAERLARTALTAALSQQADGWQPTHRHVKRGSEYTLLGIGKMQTKEWTARNPHGVMYFNVDMREVAIYRGQDGQLWVRPREEFEDGRFEALSAPATGGA